MTQGARVSCREQQRLTLLSFIRTTIEYQGTDGDDMVITRHTTRTIRNRGAYLGLVAPTAQERETWGMLIHRISGGKIVEEWSATSCAPLLEALTQKIRERVELPRALALPMSTPDMTYPIYTVTVEQRS